MLGVRQESLGWDCRLWMLREISARSYEKAGALTHSELGERENEREREQLVARSR